MHLPRQFHQGRNSLHRLVPMHDRQHVLNLRLTRYPRRRVILASHHDLNLQLTRYLRRRAKRVSHRVRRQERIMSTLLRTAMFFARLRRVGSSANEIPGRMPVRRQRSREWIVTSKHDSERQIDRQVSGRRRLLSQFRRHNLLLRKKINRNAMREQTGRRKIRRTIRDDDPRFTLIALLCLTAIGLISSLFGIFWCFERCGRDEILCGKCCVLCFFSQKVSIVL
jgi:hypothetical protein